MTIQDVKQIKLADYLQSLGYTPVKQQGRNLWYKSPLREETDASFKVNTELEKWYDFGIGKGGNIIALAAELYRSEDVAYLLKRIEEQTAYIRPASFSFGRQHSDNQPYQGLRVGELSSPALIAYLQERGINIGLAKRESGAKRFDTISYQECLERQLKVMDSTAFTLCMDNKKPIIVFDMHTPGNITRALLGEPIGTTIS